MRINHNIAALNTYRQLNSASGAQAKSMEKLSSGLRINKAGDDAAGLAISEKMRSQIRGLDMASKNAQDGVSLIQTAEGALNETHSILQRMRELAVQASNDTNTSDDRGEIQKEINQLTSEINRIGNTTEFNTKKLLNGDFEKTEAVTANVKGTTLGTTVTINGVATNGEATGAALTTLEIHSGKGESILTGYTNADPSNTAGPNVSANDNELTVTIGNTQKTITLDVKNYDNSGAGTTAADFAQNLEDKLNDVSAFGAGAVTVSFDSNNKLVIQTANSDDTITVDGGNAITHFGTATTQAAVPANNTMDITLDGVTKTITLADQNYDGSPGNDLTELKNDLQTQINNVFGASKLNVSLTGSNELLFESQSTGSNSKVSFSGAMVSTLGLSNPTTVNGTDDDTSFEITVDGETKSISLAAASTDLNVFAAQLQNSINTATTTAADVSVTVENGSLVITSGTEGEGGSVSITDNGAAKSLGLSTSNGAVKTEGADAENASLKFQIGANQGQSMDIVIGDMRGVNLGISADADNSSKVLKDSEGNNVTVSYTTGSANVTNGTNNTGVEFALDVSSAEKASAAILALDESIASVSAERSRLGSYQNRLEHTINNLGTSSENLTAAESRIRDVDMAKEMMDQTKASILSQASQAMLAQANQMPQGVLQLLR